MIDWAEVPEQDAVIAQPAAGQPVNFPCPMGAARRVKALQLSLTTNAVAANRCVRVVWYNPGAARSKCGCVAGAVQTANNAWSYIFGLNMAVIVTANVSPFSAPLLDMVMKEGDVLRILANNMDAGDQFSGPTIIYQEVSMDEYMGERKR